MQIFILSDHLKLTRLLTSFLDALQPDKVTAWQLRPTDGEEDQPDCAYELHGFISGRPFKYCAKDDGEDYGLLLRGPHPHHHSRTVMILAGPRSLGTGSACLAATKSKLISEIVQHLGDSSLLADRSKMIWALVKGIPSIDLHLDDSGVSIVAAGCRD